nr:hypothetical protein [Actinomycetota bacterium]NIU66571.1 hypothetical protein [Actinomycetota bacterium]NIW28375.1 hypothetical protein [Actinomycetota bacterium]
MERTGMRHDRPGITLTVVLVILVVVAAVSMAAALTSSNAVLIHRFDERRSVLEAV